ncbi:MAG: hypothetical protein NZ992_00250 [Candidatus Korarchaeum sp.]|nr:hypothetical protein [Candidatus Korarchaeum sp.]MDW8093372.1 hypothetical protein [Nitrososphaerota archaeon]
MPSVVSKRQVGKIERKPKFFYYIDKDGRIWETEVKMGGGRRKSKRKRGGKRKAKR